jgi:hypothetical protein
MHPKDPQQPSAADTTSHMQFKLHVSQPQPHRGRWAGTESTRLLPRQKKFFFFVRRRKMASCV